MSKPNHVLTPKVFTGDRGMRALVVATHIALLVTASAQGATTVFINRVAFESTLAEIVLDDYENPAYDDGGPFPSTTHSNTAMSAVLGETIYTSTTFAEYNLIIEFPAGNHYYCSGCNGSFRLDFTDTSVGTSSGVFGVGLSLLGSGGTHAFVTYGDGGQQDFTIPDTFDFPNPTAFWGITSGRLIKTIHFGLADGIPSSDTGGQHIEIDNLLIGSQVPEPAALTLAGILLGAMSMAFRRRDVLAATRVLSAPV